MKESEIKEWCYEIWPKHWRDLAPSSNSRALFVKEMVKLSPDEEELKRIEGSILAQTRFWYIKSKREKVFGIPRLSQWIKDCRFDDAFIDESYVDLNEQINVGQCIHCDKPVHGSKYNMCTDHTYQHEADTWSARRKQALIDLNLYAPNSKVSQSELAQKCRDFLKVSPISGLLSPQIKKSLSQPSKDSTSKNLVQET
jgi:hypothetical protein